jgi:hypothetical protein
MEWKLEQHDDLCFQNVHIAKNILYQLYDIKNQNLFSSTLILLVFKIFPNLLMHKILIMGIKFKKLGFEVESMLKSFISTNSYDSSSELFYLELQSFIVFPNLFFKLLECYRNFFIRLNIHCSSSIKYQSSIIEVFWFCKMGE